MQDRIRARNSANDLSRISAPGAADDMLGSRSAEGSAHNGQQAAGTELFGERLAVDSIARCP